jgi:hypothetical protein
MCAVLKKSRLQQVFRKCCKGLNAQASICAGICDHEGAARVPQVGSGKCYAAPAQASLDAKKASATLAVGLAFVVSCALEAVADLV